MADPLDITLVPIFAPKNRKAHARYVLATHPDVERRVGHGFPEKATPALLASIAARTFASVTIAIGATDERLIIPISAKALVGTDNAKAVLNELRRIEEADRERIIVEIHDFPARITLDALETITIPLLLFVGGFIGRMPPDLEDATVFSNCNYIALSIDCQTFPSIKPLQDIWKIAAPRRLKMFVWNLPEEAVADAVRFDVFGATSPARQGA